MTATSDLVRTVTSTERDDLRAAVRNFLAENADEQAVRRMIDADRYDASVWRGLAVDIGVTSLAVPTEYGGEGFGFTELGIVLEETGSVLAPTPFFATAVLATSALLAAGDAEASASYLPRIAEGSLTATVAVGEHWDPGMRSTVTARSADGRAEVTLTGEQALVIDGATAELALVVAETQDGPGLFAVEAGASGLERVALRVLDGTRPLARLRFDATPARPIGAPGEAGRVVEHVLRLATTALAAEQVGGARRCLDMSAAYARDRVQFGRPIGSFQAIKHKCADMFTRLRLAEAAATDAAAAADGVSGPPPLPVAAAVAHAVCSDAYVFAAAETIQVHGGIGFTWEHPAHLYYRRAKASQLLFGGPAVYYERLLRASGV